MFKKFVGFIEIITFLSQISAFPVDFYPDTQQPIYSNFLKPEGVIFSPLPGEIVFKLRQNWQPDEYLNPDSAGYKILEGNVRSAIQQVMGENTEVSDIYFREGNIPGNPTTRPKTVVHLKVNGGSDAASLLEMATQPDGTIGDGLKVYKDSFSAY